MSTAATDAKRRWRHKLRDAAAAVQAQPRLTKDEAPCCVAKRDAAGRLPVGFCSPSCLRRSKP